MNKKTFAILLFGGIIVVALIIYAISGFMNLIDPPTSPTLPQVTGVPLNTTPIVNPPRSTLLIPTAMSGGVDTNAPTVELSTNEIEKIRSSLPRSDTIILSGGQNVEIIISPPDVSRPWVLPVFIGGIDYQVPENTSDYITTRNSFREAAQEVFDLLASQGVNTSQIFINWGDRAFIQERAEQWLKN